MCEERAVEGVSVKMRLIVCVALLACLWTGACANPDAAAPAAVVAQKESAQADECVRGEPASLLASGSTFAMQGAREAQETVSGNDSPTLVIRHYGCAHFALDFSFKWPESRMPERAASLRAAAKLLESLKGTKAAGPILQNVREGLLKVAADPESTSTQLSEIESLSVAAPSSGVLVVTYDVAL